MAASSIAAMSIAGGSQFKTHEHWSKKSNMFVKTSSLAIRSKSNHLPTNRKFSVCAEYRDGGRAGGIDFLAGFVLGGAVFGALAYTFAPQIRRFVNDENEHGFRRPKRPAYFDDYSEYHEEGSLEEGLEKTKRTLNAKIGQLSSAIDSISSRLKGGNNSAKEGSDAFEPYI